MESAKNRAKENFCESSLRNLHYYVITGWKSNAITRQRPWITLEE